MTNQAGPPADGPRLSPDHQWIWDGSRWLPVAKHEAVFKNWSAVGAGLPAVQASAPVQRVPTPPPTAARQYAPPVYVQPAFVPPSPSPEQEVPLWRQRTSTGINKYLYFAAGFIGLVIVGVILSSMGTITLPWQQTSGTQSAPTYPVVTGDTDPARADSFVNHVLAPSMAQMEDSVTLVRQSCSAGLTTSCQESLIEADNRTLFAISVIDRSEYPKCVGPQTTKLRADLTRLDAAITAALKGFRDDRLGEMQGGLAQLDAALGQVQADNANLTAAAKSCELPTTTILP